MEKSSDYPVGDPRRVQAVVGEIRKVCGSFTDLLSSQEDPDRILRAARILAEGGWMVLILSDWGSGRFFNLRGATGGTRVPYYVGDYYIAKYPPGVRTIRGNFLFDIVADPRSLLPLSYVFFSRVEFRFNAGFMGIDLLTEAEIDDARRRVEALMANGKEENRGKAKLLLALDRQDPRLTLR